MSIVKSLHGIISGKSGWNTYNLLSLTCSKNLAVYMLTSSMNKCIFPLLVPLEITYLSDLNVSKQL